MKRKMVLVIAILILGVAFAAWTSCKESTTPTTTTTSMSTTVPTTTTAASTTTTTGTTTVPTTTTAATTTVPTTTTSTVATTTTTVPTSMTFNSTLVISHLHTVTLPPTDLTSPPSAGISMQTSLAGAPYTADHTHTFTMSQAQLTTVNGGTPVTVTTSVTLSHTHDFTISKWF